MYLFGIHYCHSSKSTGKEIGKSQLCPMLLSNNFQSHIYVCYYFFLFSKKKPIHQIFTIMESRVLNKLTLENSLSRKNPEVGIFLHSNWPQIQILYRIKVHQMFRSPYFRLLVFGILVTLVEWFSFQYFSVLPIFPCRAVVRFWNPGVLAIMGWA